MNAVNSRRLLRRADFGRGGPGAASNEAGISLIETVIAIVLAALLLSAGLAGLTSLMLTTAVARQRRPSPKPDAGFHAQVPIRRPGHRHDHGRQYPASPGHPDQPGARDSFDLTSSTAPAVGWTFTWHPDTNENGAVDAGKDAFTATGAVETDRVMRLLLVAAVPAASWPRAEAEKARPTRQHLELQLE